MKRYQTLLLQQVFISCTPRKNVNNRYTYYMLISPYVVDGLNSFMKGDNPPSIRKDDMERFPYPISLLPKQQRIVACIESLFAKLDQAKEKAQAKEAAETVLAHIDAMKKAILARAFRGELGTTDPAEEQEDLPC